ncbi:oxysterol-binding protein-related protein 9-like isoform X3 [Ylistrum balloti]|uniref:oxysterol-binding protein-related protein 9-like isoform X3 n=1 Tax=Ylistrum balloti TaxID=509963 RepID=UPI002905C20B|nr:oxysterol-binding protein-related protein 9-like isoform X3 [Ylistrum balloti]
MAVIEGPLSKWTNVMKGWQYRWFVLDESSGILSYFTSKEKMMRGARRGCVRLKGAVIGIDDEDDSTFTITVDQKTFHFQARDADEREKWIQGLENAILRHSHSQKKQEVKSVPTAADFDRKLSETDAYLQLLIGQVQTLETRIDACEDVSAKEKYSVLKVTAEAMIEAIKHAIVMLQIAKESLKGPVMNGTMHEAVLTTGADFDHFGRRGDDNSNSTSTTVPETSYSSSEDEDFFDAEDFKSTPKTSPDKSTSSSLVTTPSPDGEEEEKRDPPQIIASEDDYFDELYDERDDEGLGSLESHGSIIAHLLSQVRIGMDLTKVVLPTFILERRSLLEMYADFFAHPDLFIKIPDMDTPAERMIQLVRWYMSAFHAGRNSDVAKKPYNPILGETFCCHWSMPDWPKTTDLADDGPVPWSSKENLAFIAEQVSHHPPISAFYAEHYNKRISLDGYIWTKSKFLGLSIGVHMIGQAVVSLIDHDEEYVITFPNGYGRSILTVPWVELGGKVTITCAKTGFSANIDFHTKPFYGGKKHQVTGNVYSPTDKKNAILTFTGEWNGVMYAKHSSGRNEAFVDTKKMAIVKKRVKPLDTQAEFESRKLWEQVTRNLKQKNVEVATEFKHKLEHRQRTEAKERKEKGLKWETKQFHEVGEHWVYDRPLLKRLGKGTPTRTPTDTL